MEANYPKNETEFLRFIEDIDRKLKGQGLLIPARPLGAVSEACKRLKTSVLFVPNCPPIPGDYTGDSLCAHIHAWYERTYGDKLGIDSSPGSVAVLIRDDVWRIKLPLFHGAYKLVFGPFPKDEKLPGPDAEAVYPFRWIEGLTADFARSLTRKEVRHLAGLIMFALRVTRQLFRVEHQKYLPQARVDLANAVSSLFLSRPDYGQSKWASLQFAEKLFKSFLTLKEVTPPRGKKGHDLAELAKLSEDNGLRSIKPVLVNSIQCESGVRYGEIPIDAADAIRAHHASLIVCDIVCPEIERLMPPVRANRPNR